MNEKKPKLIEYLKKMIEEQNIKVDEIEQCYLFGSHLYKTNKKDSDFDVQKFFLFSFFPFFEI